MALGIVVFALLALAAAPAAGAARTRHLLVRDHDTPLLDRCGGNAAVLARLPAGHAVALRFAIGGTSKSCYAVWTRFGGDSLGGYIDRDGVEGAAPFEQALREASAARLVEEAIRTIRVPAEPVSVACF